MGFVSVLAFAQQLIKTAVRPGDSVIDATLGNGNDAAFLLQVTGKTGRLFGFDIQAEALANSQRKILRASPAALPPFVLFLDSHDQMIKRLPATASGNIGAVMFNLGYLPGGVSKDRITLPASTLEALKQACRLLREGGVVTIVLYPGHDGGLSEAMAVEAWASKLPSDLFQVILYRMWNRSEDAPYLIAVQKQKQKTFRKSQPSPEAFLPME